MWQGWFIKVKYKIHGYFPELLEKSFLMEGASQGPSLAEKTRYKAHHLEDPKGYPKYNTANQLYFNLKS